MTEIFRGIGREMAWIRKKVSGIGENEKEVEKFHESIEEEGIFCGCAFDALYTLRFL